MKMVPPYCHDLLGDETSEDEVVDGEKNNLMMKIKLSMKK